MKSEVRQGTFIQCQNCGNVYLIVDNISIEESIVESTCPGCNGRIGLNCGNKEEDIYVYMNPNLDERYYIY